MPTVHSRVPRQIAPPNDLGAEAAAEIAKALNPLVADAFALYLKTKNYHWHMSGSHFRESITCYSTSMPIKSLR